MEAENEHNTLVTLHEPCSTKMSMRLETLIVLIQAFYLKAFEFGKLILVFIVTLVLIEEKRRLWAQSGQSGDEGGKSDYWCDVSENR